MTTISVALATFEGARFLAEQVATIVAQSRKPDEIVVADDGSTDGSLAIVRGALADHPDIRLNVLESRAGHGVTANFARAIAATTGDLVALCDQDDRWHPQRLVRAASVFDRHPEAMLVHSNARLVDSRGDPLGVNLFSALRVTAAIKRAINDDPFPVLLRRNVVTGATTMFRRELFDAASPLPAEWVHDEWLAIIAAATGGIQVLDDALIDYRQHDSNQIGVTAQKLQARVARMTEPDSGRTSRLAQRSQILAMRLAELPGVADRNRTAAREKAAFEAIRARLPRPRLARIPEVLRAARGDGYRRFASQGVLDIARDLVQPR